MTALRDILVEREAEDRRLEFDEQLDELRGIERDMREVAVEIDRCGEAAEELVAFILARLPESKRKALTPGAREIIGVAAFALPIGDLRGRLAEAIKRLDGAP